MKPEMICATCGIERCDYEGPDGGWLPKCPSCFSEEDPTPSEWKPEHLRPDDRLGPFRFFGVTGGGYQFFQIVGLDFVTLHYGTVAALMKVFAIERPAPTEGQPQ